MNARAWIMGLAAISAAAIGCSKSDGDSEKVTHLGPSDTTNVSHNAMATTTKFSQKETPDKAVIQFLQAAKAGDQHRLATLMTEKAREVTEKHNVNFELETYRDASFDVGEYEYLTPDKDSAHVACKWTDRDAEGEAFTHDVIWVLRKEDEGWRVAGMITRPFPDEQPVAFDYEDFRALMEAKTSVDREMERRRGLEEKSATSPRFGDGGLKK